MHSVLASHGNTVATNVDNTHPASASTGCHHAFTIAVLPAPWSAALVGLGVVVALVALRGSLPHRVAPIGRGPPRAAATFITGQDLLTRFCLARR
ncbi:hypothetical protein CE197_13075 [Mycobacterium intracellulare subsp. chimaera]|nr:hypothetical protein CE197_13075 [Mycobacterium intracellulare subsp. chimaera]